MTVRHPDIVLPLPLAGFALFSFGSSVLCGVLWEGLPRKLGQYKVCLQQGAYHSLLVDNVLQPLEVLPLEASEDKERVSFILLRPLHGALRVGDAQGGLAAHILLKALHRC